MSRNSCCETSGFAHTSPSSGRNTPRISGASSSSCAVICCSGGVGIGEPQRARAAVIRAVRMNLGVYAAVHRVAEDVVLKELHRRVVVPVRLDDQRRQPVRMLVHPSG